MIDPKALRLHGNQEFSLVLNERLLLGKLTFVIIC